MWSCSHFVTEEFRLMMEAVKKSDFSRMEHNHHLLSGFKAIFSDSLVRNIDEARRGCGGAGYQSNSGFTDLYRDASPIPTYEGDNIVMLGQASRYLMKLVNKARKKQNLNFPFDYLNQLHQTLSAKNSAKTVEDFKSLKMLDKALQARACHMIMMTVSAYEGSKENNKRKDNDIFQQQKLDMVKAHLRCLQLRLFLAQMEKFSFKDAKVKGHLETLGKIYVLD